MPDTTLGLVVLRCADLGAALAFYRALGLRFVEERHGNGPVHHAATLGDGVVLELYPALEGAPVDRRARGAVMLGFRVASLTETLTSLASLGARALTPLHAVSEARRAVVLDPDGRAVELVG